MGNEAIALGAIKAGVRVVCGYPGTPSTEILETVAKNNDGSIYTEWSVNEKTAMEVAAGAAYSGARAMVTMKQVGLNVASDPLMSLACGVKAGWLSWLLMTLGRCLPKQSRIPGTLRSSPTCPSWTPRL